MKKIIILNLAALLFASAVFADDNVVLSVTTTGLTLYAAKTSGAANTAGADQKLIGKCSTGVGVGVKSSTQGYSAETQHKNGIKAYGSSNDSTAIYMKDVVAGTADGTTLKTGKDSFDGVTGWTSM